MKLKKYFLLFFFFSGFASLIYQVVWQRLLTVHYGVGFLSTVLIVSIYMFGLGVGALIGGYWAEKKKNKIVLYSLIELGIGIFGILSPLFLDFLGKTTSGLPYYMNFFFIFIFLSVPTILMGTTLPVLIKIYNRINQNFLSSISTLYFINTIGAAIGALISSYILISFLGGLDNSIYIASSINIMLGVAIVILLKYSPQKENEFNNERKSVKEILDNSLSVFQKLFYNNIPIIIFITGFLAIGYEIIWVRWCGVLLKDSPYAFSSILFIYLLGIALGSYYVSRKAQSFSLKKTINIFSFLQILIAFYVSIIAILFVKAGSGKNYFTALLKMSFSKNLHPDFSANVFSRDVFFMLDAFFWPSLVFLIPTILMGASFPLISQLALKNPQKEGETIGKVYFFNITGNVMGGIITGFLLLPLLTSETTLLIFILLGLCFVTMYSKTFKSNFFVKSLVVLFGIFVILIFPSKNALMSSLHQVDTSFKKIINEGKEGVICTIYKDENLVSYINGSAHGGRPNEYFEFETVEALSYTDTPDSVLVIGFGTGLIVEGLINNPLVKKVTLIEINETLIHNLNRIDATSKILKHPKLEVVIEDGRRFLTIQKSRKWDLIMMDPLRTTTSYSNNIYSKEFFNITSSHIKPKGVLVLWTDELNIIPLTVSSVYNYVNFYERLIVASNSILIENTVRKEDIINTYFPKLNEKFSLFSSEYLGDKQYIISQKAAIYPINTDWKPNTEYYIGIKK